MPSMIYSDVSVDLTKLLSSSPGLSISKKDNGGHPNRCCWRPFGEGD